MSRFVLILLSSLLQITVASFVIEVVAALNQPQYPGAVTTAARVIVDHCDPDHANVTAKREAFVKAGAIPALMFACKTHLNHVGVLENACRAFTHLCMDDVNRVCCWTRWYHYLSLLLFHFSFKCVTVFFFFHLSRPS